LIFFWFLAFLFLTFFCLLPFAFDLTFFWILASGF